MDEAAPNSFTQSDEEGEEQADEFPTRNRAAPRFDASGLAAWLKKTLRETGTTPSEVAKRSGLSKGTVSKIANPRAGAEHDALTVRRVAEAAGGSVLEAFAAAGFLADLTGREAEILRGALAMHGLTDKELTAVLNLIEELGK